MVKFVITEDAMSPIAQALSGQSRMAGVAAGLKNQMLGLELDKMREERQQAQQQRQMRENLIPSRISRLFPQLSEGARNILAGQLTGQKPEQGVPSDLFQYQADRYAAEHAMTLPQWANAQRYADAIQMNNAFGGNGLEAIKGIGLAQDNANKEYYDMAAIGIWRTRRLRRETAMFIARIARGRMARFSTGRLGNIPRQLPIPRA